MREVSITIYKHEIDKIKELRQKLKDNGFKLNDKFENYIVPIQGTYITNYSSAYDRMITITQTFD